MDEKTMSEQENVQEESSNIIDVKSSKELKDKIRTYAKQDWHVKLTNDDIAPIYEEVIWHMTKVIGYVYSEEMERYVLYDSDALHREEFQVFLDLDKFISDIVSNYIEKELGELSSYVKYLDKDYNSIADLKNVLRGEFIKQHAYNGTRTENYSMEQTKEDVKQTVKTMPKIINDNRMELVREKIKEFQQVYDDLMKNNGTQKSNTFTFPVDINENTKIDDDEIDDNRDVFETSTPYFDVTKNGTMSEVKTSNDNNPRVDHPKYYNLEDGPSININGVDYPIECIDVIRDMPTWKGNVFKYLWRCGAKQEQGLSSQEKELEDMKKALWYLNDKIQKMESSLTPKQDKVTINSSWTGRSTENNFISL